METFAGDWTNGIPTLVDLVGQFAAVTGHENVNRAITAGLFAYNVVDIVHSGIILGNGLSGKATEDMFKFAADTRNKLSQAVQSIAEPIIDVTINKIQSCGWSMNCYFQ